MIVILLAVWGGVQDAFNTARGGSIDLRNRITGIRVATEHRDPYTFKWSRTESGRYLDPFNSPASPVSHTTVTPATLTLFLPFRDLSYRLTQGLWFVIQYACLGLGFLAWARSVSRHHWLWGGLFTALFCLTPHWRFHMDRGQTYVLLAALFLAVVRAGSLAADAPPPAASLRSGGKKRRALILESLGASLLTLLRPTCGAALGIAAARRSRVAALAAMGGILFWAVLPVLLGGTSIWKNYFSAMGIHAANYLERKTFPNARFSATETVEGIPIETFLHFPRIPFSDTSVYRLVSFELSPTLLLPAWAVLAAASGFLLMRRGLTGTPRFWWAVSAWTVIGDFLLPAYRYPYNNILVWPLLLLGLAATEGRARTVWITLSTGLLLFHTLTWWLPHSLISGPSAASLILAIVTAVWALCPARLPDQSTGNPS